MANIKLMKWNPVEHLKSNKDRMAYLEAALEESDPALVCAVIGDIAKAHGMSSLATRVGIVLKPVAAKSKPKTKKNLKSHKAA